MASQHDESPRSRRDGRGRSLRSQSPRRSPRDSVRHSSRRSRSPTRDSRSRHQPWESNRRQQVPISEAPCSDLRVPSAEPSFYVLSDGTSSDNTPPTSISPFSHETAHTCHHLENLDAFARDINNAARRAFPNKPKDGHLRYQTVNVCLIRWEGEDEFHDELKRLDDTFQKYGFSTNVWLIPSMNAYRDLMRKTLDFVDTYDTDQNLFVLYYAGHGKMNDNRQKEWVYGQRPNAPSLEGSAILSLFADAKSDVLALLDTCAAASAVTKSQFGVMEVIAACGFEGRAAPAGEHSFTNTLIETLEDWIGVPAFSASFLHAEIIRQLKRKEQKRGREGNRLEWCSTPIYIWCAKDSDRPGIQIGRRNDLPSGSSSGQCSSDPTTTSGIDPTSIYSDDSNNCPSRLSFLDSEGRYNTPHVQISLRLTADQPLNPSTANCCAEWLGSIPLLTKWAIVEAIYPSFSTLLMLSVPVPIWNLLPDSPAWSSIGYVTGPNYGPIALGDFGVSLNIATPMSKTCDASTQCDLGVPYTQFKTREQYRPLDDTESNYPPPLISGAGDTSPKENALESTHNDNHGTICSRALFGGFGIPTPRYQEDKRSPDYHNETITGWATKSPAQPSTPIDPQPSSATTKKSFHCKAEGCGRSFSVSPDLREHRKRHRKGHQGKGQSKYQEHEPISDSDVQSFLEDDIDSMQGTTDNDPNSPRFSDSGVGMWP